MTKQTAEIAAELNRTVEAALAKAVTYHADGPVFNAKVAARASVRIATDHMRQLQDENDRLRIPQPLTMEQAEVALAAVEHRDADPAEIDRIVESVMDAEQMAEENRILRERVADLENGLTILHLQFAEPYHSWQRVLYRVQQLIRRRNACAEVCINTVGVLRGRSILTTEELIQKCVDAVSPVISGNDDELPQFSQGVTTNSITQAYSAPESRDPMRMIQDDDCHWYVIYEAKQDEFIAWCKSMKDCTAPPSDWEPTRINGPASIRIFDYEKIDL